MPPAPHGPALTGRLRPGRRSRNLAVPAGGPGRGPGCCEFRHRPGLPGWASPSPTGPSRSDASGILTTWYKRVHTCFKYVCTCYVQCLSTAADRHGMYKNENTCTCFKHVHTCLQINEHVCTWYVHGMYKVTYKRVCTLFKHVCTRL